MASSKVLIVVDTSDLQRVAEKLHLTAATTSAIMQEGLQQSAAFRKITLEGVTPRSEDRDVGRYPSKSQRSPGHLQDSYYYTVGQSIATIGTNDASKWNIVNAAQGTVIIRPLFKKALSWPGMTGPVSKPDYPWWPPTPGYPVSPVSNFRGWSHPGHPDMNLRERASNLYEGMDQIIMQNLADAMAESVTYGPAGVAARMRRRAQAMMQPRDVKGRFVKMR